VIPLPDGGYHKPGHGLGLNCGLSSTAGYVEMWYMSRGRLGVDDVIHLRLSTPFSVSIENFLSMHEH
jgi:hypothetical protein